MAQIKKDANFNFSLNSLNDKSAYTIREIKVGVIDEDAINSEIYDDDAEALQELIEDIKSVGLSTPLTVRRHKSLSDRYTLISGHRRLKAVKSLGFVSVPCLVIATENEEDALKADIMHLTSNILTRERTILERAREAKLLKQRVLELKKISPTAYQGKTDNIVAKMLNVSSSYVRQLVRVDNADEDIKALLSTELIGISEALKLQQLDISEKVRITDEIRQANDEGELRSVKRKGLDKATCKKEKSVDEQIRVDLEKIEELIRRIDGNISESRLDFNDEINNIVCILTKILN